MNALVVRTGWPITLGPLVFTPEVGYAFDALDLDAAFQGAQAATFISSEVHLGLVGGRIEFPFSKRFLVDGDWAFAFGAASVGPGSLGSDGGLALGGRGSLGIHYLFNSGLGLVLRYAVEGWSAEFSGSSTLDETITEATLGELRHLVLMGASYSL